MNDEKQSQHNRVL